MYLINSLNHFLKLRKTAAKNNKEGAAIQNEHFFEDVLHGLAGEYTEAIELVNLMHRLRRVWHGFQPKPPLTRSDLSLLGTIAQMGKPPKEGVTVSRIAKSLNQSLPGVSQKVSALEKDGYLRRAENQQDRRVANIVLTAKGRKVAAGSMQEFLQRVELALTQLGSDKTAQLMDLMQQLSDAIEMVQQQEGVDSH